MIHFKNRSFTKPRTFLDACLYKSMIDIYHVTEWVLLEETGPLEAGHIIYLNVFNSLDPGKFEWHFRYLFVQITLVIDGTCISREISPRWMSLDLTDDKSTLVQVMAWCRQATSHYLSQCWPRYLSSYGATRPQWVNLITSYLTELMTTIGSERVCPVFSWKRSETLGTKLQLLLTSDY